MIDYTTAGWWNDWLYHC